MAGKQITDSEKNIVVQQYQDGWPIRKIAAYANMSQTTVLKIVKEKGVKLRKNRSTNENKKEGVKRMYMEGSSINDIMIATGVKSTQTIYSIINANRRKMKETK